MPTANISCIHPGLKAIMVHEAASHILDLAERQIFLRLVAALPDCQGTLIGFETPATSRQQPGGTGRTKRAPSAYNLFIKKCASSKAKGGEGKDFKACSIEWKQRKPQGVKA